MADDVLALAAVVGQRDANRAALARRLIDEAHAAHRFFRRCGRSHPVWGNGSLMSRCLAENGYLPAGDRDWLAGLPDAAAAIVEWQHRRA